MASQDPIDRPSVSEDDILIAAAPLRTATKNALHQAGLKTVGEARALGHLGLSRIWGMGAKAIAEVLAVPGQGRPSVSEEGEMVERAARAIQASCVGSLQPNDRSAQRFARAAIAAMREPTGAMIEAYSRKHEELGFTAWANASAVLPVVIDAALSHKQS